MGQSLAFRVALVSLEVVVIKFLLLLLVSIIKALHHGLVLGKLLILLFGQLLSFCFFLLLLLRSQLLLFDYGYLHLGFGSFSDVLLYRLGRFSKSTKNLLHGLLFRRLNNGSGQLVIDLLIESLGDGATCSLEKWLLERCIVELLLSGLLSLFTLVDCHVGAIQVVLEDETDELGPSLKLDHLVV